MRTLVLLSKGIFWLIIVMLASPLVWLLGRPSDSFEGEVFSDYDDDDDEGEEVDV